MRFIHITDPHLSSLEESSFLELRGKRRSGYLSWRRNRRHVHRREILDRLTTAVLAHRPDLVLVTGDLVHIGLKNEIIEAAAWLKQLGPPEKVLFVPGNHDNYARDSLAAMYRHWREYLPGKHTVNGDYAAGYPMVSVREKIKFIGVNSACTTRIFSARGELGAPQRQRLVGELDLAGDESLFRCLLIHHPPFPGMTKSRKALRDAEALREIVSQRPVDLMLYGHIHINREDRENAVRSFCTASASDSRSASYRVFDVRQAGGGWTCRMRLMSLVAEAGPQAEFRLAAEDAWRA